MLESSAAGAAAAGKADPDESMDMSAKQRITDEISFPSASPKESSATPPMRFMPGATPQIWLIPQFGSEASLQNTV